jgi:hypothetical protein
LLGCRAFDLAVGEHCFQLCHVMRVGSGHDER